MDRWAALGTHSGSSSLHLMHPTSVCPHAAQKFMGGEKYQHLCWWLEMSLELFPEKPMTKLSVMAVSLRHRLLCCVRYCTSIPFTEDLQDAATHTKHLVPDSHCENLGEGQILTKIPGNMFVPQRVLSDPPPGSDISSVFEETTKGSSVLHAEGARLPFSAESKLQGEAGSCEPSCGHQERVSEP